MKAFSAVIAIIAISSVYCDCDFDCQGERHFVRNGAVFDCPSGQICNSKCNLSDPAAEICVTPEKICPYECEGAKIKFPGISSSIYCPNNEICNHAHDSCLKVCIGDKCPNYEHFFCVNESTVNVLGLETQCPGDTVCNSKRLRPVCSYCTKKNGERSNIRSWLTS